MNGQHPRGRPGFTLVELLVVISIIGFLGAMAYFVSGALFRSDRAQRGGATTQSVFSIAKQQSLRDRVIYGVRLVPDSSGQFTGLEYIFQPPDYVENRYRVTSIPPTGPIPNGLTFERDISGGLGLDKGLWPIQVGDVFLKANDTTPHMIGRVGPDPGNPPTVRALGVNEVELLSPLTAPYPLTFTSQFRIMRGARSVAGEEIVKLPDDIVIDAVFSKVGTGSNATLGATGAIIPSVVRDPLTGHANILFAPAQGVVGISGRSGKIILWVRERDQPPALRADGAVIPHPSKDQVMVVIFTRTGSIATYPVDTSGRLNPLTNLPDPYSFTNDPRATGL